MPAAAWPSRPWFMPIAQPEIFLGAHQQVADTDLGQPLGMILSGGTIWFSAALPLQDWVQSQFVALRRILAGGDLWSRFGHRSISTGDKTALIGRSPVRRIAAVITSPCTIHE